MKTQHPISGQITLLLTLTVVIVALSLGGVLVFTDLLQETFSENRKLAGGLLMIYGCYRGFMGWRRYTNQQRDHEEE